MTKEERYKMKEWAKKLPIEILNHIIKNFVWYILSTGGVLLFLRYFRQLPVFLNRSVNILIGILFILVLISFLIGYELAKPRRKEVKYYFYESSKDIKWWITEFPTEVSVEEEPYCGKCETKFLSEKTRSYPFEVFSLSCPACGNQINGIRLRELHRAAENIVECRLKQKLKS